MNIIGFGCAIGFPAILLPQLSDPSSPLHLTKSEESWIGKEYSRLGIIVYGKDIQLGIGLSGIARLSNPLHTFLSQFMGSCSFDRRPTTVLIA